MNANLFATPPVPGFSEHCDVIDADEERVLIAAIDGSTLTPFQFQGWEGKRLTASFGWSYDFQTGGFAMGQAIPDFLMPFRERIASVVGLTADRLEQALLTRYDPGAGIGWHRDRPQFDHVVGLSLGSPAMLRLRRRLGPKSFARASAALRPRGIYYLTGEVRHDWEHSITPSDQTRWSVTFRTLSELGMRARDP